MNTWTILLLILALACVTYSALLNNGDLPVDVRSQVLLGLLVVAGGYGIAKLMEQYVA